MELKLFKTLWGHTGPLALAADQAVAAGFVGLEGNADVPEQRRYELLHALHTRQLAYIQEIVTAGSLMSMRSSRGRNISQSMTAFRRSSGSPASERLA